MRFCVYILPSHYLRERLIFIFACVAPLYLVLKMAKAKVNQHISSHLSMFVYTRNEKEIHALYSLLPRFSLLLRSTVNTITTIRRGSLKLVRRIYDISEGRARGSDCACHWQKKNTYEVSLVPARRMTFHLRALPPPIRWITRVYK